MRRDRQDLRRQLAALAAAQSGCFTAKQALGVGYTYQAQKYDAATIALDVAADTGDVEFPATPCSTNPCRPWAGWRVASQDGLLESNCQDRRAIQP